MMDDIKIPKFNLSFLYSFPMYINNLMFRINILYYDWNNNLVECKFSSYSGKGKPEYWTIMHSFGVRGKFNLVW
jgi:hypothetical protein